MTYTYEQIFTRNDTVINTLVAEEIMEELKPIELPDFRKKENHSMYSTGGWWICIPHHEEETCEWFALNFSGNFRLAWQAVKKLRATGSSTQIALLQGTLQVLSPFESQTEKDVARKICRAVLLAKLETLPIAS